MPSDVKITPYKCRTLYLEYRDIMERKKTAVDFIVKSDLWDLAKDVKHDTLKVEEMIHLCMGIFVKVANLYENTHDYFKNYLDGIGTINESNKIALGLNLKSCQEEILRAQITTSPVLNYIYFSLVNNRGKRDLIPHQDIVEELTAQQAITATSNMEEGLRGLNFKIQEVTNIVNNLRTVGMEFDVSDSMRLLEGVESKLTVLGNEQEKQKNDINKKAVALRGKILETGNKFDNLTTQTENTLNHFGLIMKDIGERIAVEGERADQSLATQKVTVDRILDEGDLVNEMTNRLKSTLDGLEEMFTNNESTTSLLDTIAGIQGYVMEFQGSVKMQTLMTKEIDEKVRTVEEGLSVIKQVLDSLNAIMREDILINLARSGRGVTETARGVEALGTKYSQIREGGYI